MKKLSLIIILFWQCTIADAQTSVYHEFPDSNATWNVFWSHGGLEYCAEHVYSFSDDTLINGLVYQKIVDSSYGYNWARNNWLPYGYCDTRYTSAPSIGYFAIREDIPQRKVYIIPSGDTIPQLLYDFNLNVGDTLNSYIVPVPIIVLSVDSILINSDYRKRWTYNTDIATFYIIEGIGSSCGLLEASFFELGSNLDCFSQNDQTLYPAYDATSGCVFITSILENKEMENELFILPNPSDGKFQVKWNGIKANTLEITDILGNIIVEFRIKNSVMDLDLTSQPKGIYLIKITDSSGNFAIKKIVKE